ncbi:MAG: hypothetical protein JWN41_1781 [Thermoleophilia bacterium]|nr:hypothetical protein [Thermoleophilia bacterium]
MKRPPRIPTWVIAVLSALVLGAASALFYAGQRHVAAPKPASEPRTSADSDLQLPKTTTTATDPRRRGATGRERVATPDETDAVASDDDPASTTKRLRALQGTRVTLAPADATTPAVRASSRTTRIGTVAVSCAPPATSAAARSSERQVLDALATELRAAGAIVTRLDDASGAVPCAPQRVAQLERADLAIVIASVDTPGAAIAVAAARPSARLSTADSIVATRLVGAIAAVTQLPVIATKSTAPLSKLLTSFGVLDVPGGGSTAWVVTPAGTDAALFAHQIALGMASAVSAAATATHSSTTTSTTATAPTTPTSPSSTSSSSAATSQ